MTNDERIRAFQMRLDGYTWDAIGKVLGYSHATVYQDLRSCVTSHVRQPSCIYPALSKVIMGTYGGTVSKFAIACNIPPTTLHGVLRGKSAPNKGIIDAILKTTGLSYEEAFRYDESL